MARVVRKVSNKNLANANKNKKVNKWFIGGIITGVLVAIAVAIVLFVTLGGNDETQKVDYLDTFTLEDGTVVEFNKANHDGLLNLMDENYPGYVDGLIIVFAYNSESFVIDEEDNKVSQNESLISYLQELQVKVNEAKALDKKVELYIVDISISESDWMIMGDSTFGGSTNVTVENLATVQPLFAVIDNTAEDKLVESCSRTTLASILSTAIKNTEEKIDNIINGNE